MAKIGENQPAQYGTGLQANVRGHSYQARGIIRGRVPQLLFWIDLEQKWEETDVHTPTNRVSP